MVVLSHLRTLTHLDGRLVSEEEVVATTQMGESRIDQVGRNCMSSDCKHLNMHAAASQPRDLKMY